MKKLIKSFCIGILLTIVMVIPVFAMEWNWETVPGHHNQSVLLEEGATSSEDAIHRYGRGDYLADAYIEIGNMQDGTLRVEVMTFAHMNVDRILHSFFVDVWDEDENDWIQVANWHVEKTKEEAENGELFMLSTTVLLTDCEVGRYYRARGLHGVELYDELEACATETNGVQLTDWRDW